MAVNEGLMVTLGADASGLEQASAQAVKSLHDVAKAADDSKGAVTSWTQFVGQRMGSYMKQYGGHAEAIKKIAEEWNEYKKTGVNAFNSVTPTLEKSNNSLGKFRKTAEGSTETLINLSRVAQDAPYGFLGIANNLNPLLESFQRLRSQSGSNVNAFKALVGGLTGPAGIGLALGVVSSLLVKFGDQLFDTSSKAEKNAALLKKQREELDNYVQSLSDIPKVRLLGAQNAQEELVKLQAIYTASQNTNLAYAERKKAVDALQEQYPKYFANLKDEEILAGRGKEAYDRLTTAILASARARAAQDQLVDIQKQLLAVESKRAAARTKEIEASNKVIQARKDEINLQRQVIGGGTAQAPLVNTGAITSQANLNAKQKETNELTKQWLELNKRASGLTAEINKNVVENGVDALTGDLKGKLSKAGKEQYNFFDNFFDFDYNKSDLKEKQKSELLKAARGFQKDFGSAFKGLDFYQPTEDASLNAARAWWANFRKGIISFKPKAFIFPDFTKDVPIVIERQSIADKFSESMQQVFSGKKQNLGILDAPEELRKRIVDKYEVELSKVGEQLPKTVNVDGIDVQLKDVRLGSDADKQVEAALKVYKDKLDAARKNIGQAFNSLATDSFSSFGQALGEMLSNNDAGAGIQIMTDFLAAAIKQIGEALIQYGIVKEGLDKVLKAGFALPGIAAIAIGTAAVAASALIKKSQVPKMAQGGIIPPGFNGDKFPAMLNSNEAVIPLEKMHKYINQGSNSPVVLETIIRGNDLALVQARNARKQRRVA